MGTPKLIIYERFRSALCRANGADMMYKPLMRYAVVFHRVAFYGHYGFRQTIIYAACAYNYVGGDDKIGGSKI